MSDAILQVSTGNAGANEREILLVGSQSATGVNIATYLDSANDPVGDILYWKLACTRAGGIKILASFKCVLQMYDNNGDNPIGDPITADPEGNFYNLTSLNALETKHFSITTTETINNDRRIFFNLVITSTMVSVFTSTIVLPTNLPNTITTATDDNGTVTYTFDNHFFTNNNPLRLGETGIAKESGTVELISSDENIIPNRAWDVSKGEKLYLNIMPNQINTAFTGTVVIGVENAGIEQSYLPNLNLNGSGFVFP